jgi:hypothetical protein
MKTKRYTTAMLIALVFSTTTIQAQSARRPVSEENRKQTSATRTYTGETSSQKAKSTQPAKKEQPQRVNPQQARTSQPANYSNSQQAYNKNERNNQTNEVRRPVSMTTTNNPRSTYRTPNNLSTAEPRYSAPVKSQTYNHKSYYGGNHYHYAYPTQKANFHYHHDTYLGHYNVLYYPSYDNIYWNRNMYHNYHSWYPGFAWNYSYGHRIQSISVFDAKYNLGEVAMVYGRVYATWYNEETNDYLLFFGGDFPNQQFTVVVPAYVARKYSWRPETYFLGEHITVTGLITTYDGSPEIVVKNKSQLGLY